MSLYVFKDSCGSSVAFFLRLGHHNYLHPPSGADEISGE
jgi:hypothetical protein